MWAEKFTGFLLDCRLRLQPVNDGPAPVLLDRRGRAAPHSRQVFDDYKAVVQSEAKAAEFSKAWEERYRDRPEIGDRDHLQ